jgi:RsmE family RNA methyltransferase
MNLILIHPKDFHGDDRQVRLTGRRFRHIQEVLKSKTDDRLTVGLLNGNVGVGRINEMDSASVVLDVEFNTPPPKPLELTLILALPRPQVIKRALQCAGSLGIKKIILLNFYRVEKSLWQSSALKTEAINEQLELGLEQAKDTLMPEVFLRKSFKAFTEDELPDLIKKTLPLVAHPGTAKSCPENLKEPVTLVIGPEGGLVDFEIKKLTELGFRAIDLGERILKVEVVLPFLVGKIF